MGGFDKMKNKAKEAASRNVERVREGTQRAGDRVEEKTGGKEKAQKAREKLGQRRGDEDEDDQPQP